MSSRLFTCAGIEFRRAGRFVRIVRPSEEWDTTIDNPEEVIKALRNTPGGADLFTFMQRLPHSRPRFGYYREWDNVAAIPISSYEHWLNRQLHRNPRNKLRKSQKEGLTVRVVPFDDDLVRGIKEIQDETPIRQGRPFTHYRKTPEQVRAGYATYMDRATFLGAFYRDSLVGFLKLVSTGGYARTMGLLATLRHRDLAPMNALIAKAVEVCAEKGYSHLIYGRYDYGKVGADSVVDFKYYNGFEHILLPRYFVPLTARGRQCLALGLHQGVVALLPRSFAQRLRRIKVSYYEWRYPRPPAASIRRAENPAPDSQALEQAR